MTFKTQQTRRKPPPRPTTKGDWENADVITLIECEGDGNYMLKITKHPDTEAAKNHQFQQVTPNGTPVVVCASFADILTGKSIARVLELYDEAKRRKIKGDLFTVQDWRLWDFWGQKFYE